MVVQTKKLLYVINQARFTMINIPNKVKQIKQYRTRLLKEAEFLNSIVLQNRIIVDMLDDQLTLIKDYEKEKGGAIS